MMPTAQINGFKESCVFDLCALDGDIEFGLCVAAEAIATTCSSDYSIKEKWRGDNFCSMYSILVFVSNNYNVMW